MFCCVIIVRLIDTPAHFRPSVTETGPNNGSLKLSLKGRISKPKDEEKKHKKKSSKSGVSTGVGVIPKLKINLGQQQSSSDTVTCHTVSSLKIKVTNDNDRSVDGKVVTSPNNSNTPPKKVGEVYFWLW